MEERKKGRKKDRQMEEGTKENICKK